MRWRVLFVYLAMLLTMGFALPYWAHPLDHQLWVKMNVTPGYEGYYVYYNGTKDYSNGTATFWFFDDFSTWSGWIQHLSGVVSQDTTTFAFPTLRKDLYGDPSGGYKALPSLLNFPFLLQAGVDRTYLSGANADRFGVVDSSGNGYGFIFAHPNAIGYDVRSGYVATYTPLVGLASDIYQKWYIGRLTWQNGNIGVELRDSSNNLVAKGGAYNTAYSSFNDVYVFGGYRYFLAYLFVAKYNRTAPLVLYGPAEQGNWIINGQTYTERRFILFDYHRGSISLDNFQVQLDYQEFNSTNMTFSPASFVSFVDPTPPNNTQVQIYNALTINVAAGTPRQTPQLINISSITINVYNGSTGQLISYRTCTPNSQSANCTFNYLLFVSGTYKVNATAVLTNGTVLHTETRSYDVLPSFPNWQDKRDKELWVKVPLRAGRNIFYIYYNSSKSYSNPNQVFLFFDDFNGTSLNLSKWTTSAITISTARYSVENSYLNMSDNWGVCCSGGCIYSHLNTLKSFTPPFAVESRFMPEGAISLASGYQICYHTIFANVDAIGISSAVDAFSFRYGYYSTYYSLPATVPQLDVWHRTTEIFSPTELSVKTDYITTPYTYGYTTAPSGPIGLAGDTDLTDGYDLVDWIAVRNYTSPEPIVTYGQPSQGSWVVDGVTYHNRRIVYIDSSVDLGDYQVELNYSLFDLQNVCVQYGEGVAWAPPTPSNNTYELSTKTINVNATASSYPITYVKSINLTIYNDSGVVDSYTCTYSAGSTQVCAHNLTVNAYGTYYINATASFGVGAPKTSEVRVIHFVRSKPYWVDERDGEIWFKTAFQPGQNVFYIYYNSSKSYSNPNQVFLFFDDFNGTSLNLSKWSTALTTTSGEYSVENGHLTMWNNWGGCCAGSCIYAHLNTLKSFTPPFAVESRFMPEGAISLASGYQICYHTIFANVDAIGISSAADAFSFRYGTLYTYYSLPATVPQLDVWHRTTEIFSPTELSVKTDYITTPYTYGYTTAPSGPIGLAGDTDLTDGYDLVDWIAVRNYTSPEPAITGWGPVESGNWVVDGETYHNRRMLVTYSIQYLPTPYQIKFNYTSVNDTNLSIIYVGKYTRPPTLSFALPTPPDGTTLYQTSFVINLTFAYSDNATIHVLDIDSGTKTNFFCTSSPCLLTISQYGHYKFNATACNGIGCNTTENRTVFLSNGTVFMSFNPPTPADGSTVTQQPIKINVSATAVPALANITLDVSNSTTVILHQVFLTSPATAVLVLLGPGTYTIRATGCNTLKVCNTSTTTFTIPAPSNGCTLYLVVRNMDITPLHIDYVVLDGQRYLVNQTLNPLQQKTLKIVNKSICYYYVLGKHGICSFAQLGFIYERNGLIMMLPPAEYPICAVLEDESG